MKFIILYFLLLYHFFYEPLGFTVQNENIYITFQEQSTRISPIKDIANFQCERFLQDLS